MIIFTFGVTFLSYMGIIWWFFLGSLTLTRSRSLRYSWFRRIRAKFVLIHKSWIIWRRLNTQLYRVSCRWTALLSFIQSLNRTFICLLCCGIERTCFLMVPVPDIVKQTPDNFLISLDHKFLGPKITWAESGKFFQIVEYFFEVSIDRRKISRVSVKTLYGYISTSSKMIQ
jgi:hypothetical protein